MGDTPKRRTPQMHGSAQFKGQCAKLSLKSHTNAHRYVDVVGEGFPGDEKISAGVKPGSDRPRLKDDVKFTASHQTRRSEGKIGLSGNAQRRADRPMHPEHGD